MDQHNRFKPTKTKLGQRKRGKIKSNHRVKKTRKRRGRGARKGGKRTEGGLTGTNEASKER
jgi:hypothetical protein